MPVRLDPEAVWQALTHDSGACVSVLDEAGFVLYVNDEAAAFLFDAEPEDVIGRHTSTLLPQDVGDERLSFLERLRTSDKPLQVRSVWRGLQTRSVWRRIESDPPRILIVMRPEPGELPPASPEYEHASAKVLDFGPINKLTPREREVLALIGQGNRIRDIAVKLHRSPKTIERHREAIGQKLNLHDRASLIDAARRAGLTYDG